jgi:hypothetical protein
MIISILILWAVTATAVAGIFHTTLKIQQQHIQLLEAELKFSDMEIEALARKQKFQPVNRVFGGKPR